MDISVMEKRIKRYKVVSFDIFDTLLKRDVFKPRDVFRIVENNIKKRYQIDSNFRKIRIEAEKRARERSLYPEITLDEIYAGLNDQSSDLYKALELEAESQVLHCNYNIKPLYDSCIAAGKNVYIVSDMYLSEGFLEEVLKREGFDGYKTLIVSAKYRKTKRSGELFKAFLEKFGIDRNEVIHIGDSWHADFIGARKAGIKSIHIPRVTKNTLYTPVPDKNSGFETRSLFAFINSRVGKFGNRDERFGYEVLGPVLYSYCQWIHNQYEAIKNSNSRLWFAARDMYLFKEAYKIIYGDKSEPDYLYISRRSLRPVLTYTTGKITESGEVFARGMYTIQEIAKKMGYKVTELADETFNNDTKYNIRALGEYAEVRRLLSSKIILDKEQELAALGIRYLKANGLFDSDIVLADVGWHGTTQYILKRIQESVSEKGKLFGLYLGCLDGTNERIGKNNYKAFAFSEEERSNFPKGILLFESLILAPHGSTVRYHDKGDAVIPVLGEPDNLTDYLISVQRGAVNFVKDYSNCIFGNNIELYAQITTKAFVDMAMYPLKEELEKIGDMDYENFGIDKISAPKPMLAYIKRPKLLYSDLKYSPWRIGFLYRLFKIRLPYAKMYSLARKKQGKVT